MTDLSNHFELVSIEKNDRIFTDDISSVSCHVCNEHIIYYFNNMCA